MLRLAVIGVLIYLATMEFQNDDKAIQSDCCNCYQLAKNASLHQSNSYDKHHDRFDLSMCIPNCADCTYCDQQIGSVYSEITCPATQPNYTPDKHWVHGDWYRHTGCKAYEHQISLVEFFFFSKSYRSYRRLSTVIISSYMLLLLIFLLLLCPNIEHRCGISAGLDKEFSRAVLFFNALLSPVCLYFILKPYEYHAEPFTIYGKSITCSRVAITVSTRHAVVAMLVGLLIFVVLYGIMECVNCRRWCNTNADRGHVNAEMNQQLIGNGDEEINGEAYDVKKSQHYLWNKIKTLFGTLFCLWIFAFFVVLICSIAEMTSSFQRFGDLHVTHIKRQFMLYLSAALSFSLLLDFLFVSTPRELLKEYCEDATQTLLLCCNRDDAQNQVPAQPVPMRQRDDQ